MIVTKYIIPILPTLKSMATETPKTQTVAVRLGPETFNLAVRLDNRSDDKGAFLALDPKTVDVGILNRFIVAAGQGPLVAAVVKAFNKIIGPASKEAFTETEKDGKVDYQLDNAKASNIILTAIAESVSAAKDELEAKLAQAREVYEKFFGESVMPLMAAGRVVPPEVVARMGTLRMEVETINKKLTGKTRPKKADKAADKAPAK